MGTTNHSLGIDLGGTKIFAVVFDADFNEVGSCRVPTMGFEGPDQGLKRIAECAREALEDAEIAATDLRAVGIGCPGVVDFEKGVLRHAPNLGWNEIGVGRYLAKEFDCPIAILNDVDAGTFGEYSRGAGTGARSLLGVFPGTGVGGGFVYEGKILRGKSASCLEIGNIRLLGSSLEGVPVRLENLSSRLSIACACAAEAYRGKAPTILERAGTDIQRIKSGTVRKAFESGDRAVEQIVEQAIDYLAIGIAAAVDLLAPDTIVIGGGLAEKMPEQYKKGVKKGMSAYASPALVEDVRIKIAELGDHAVTVGAAAYAIEQGTRFAT